MMRLTDAEFKGAETWFILDFYRHYKMEEKLTVRFSGEVDRRGRGGERWRIYEEKRGEFEMRNGFAFQSRADLAIELTKEIWRQAGCLSYGSWTGCGL